MNFTVPETPVNNTYRLMAEDANYTWANGGTSYESANFRVMGVIDLTAPSSPATWRITDTKTFTWDITNGEIHKVKIMAYPGVGSPYLVMDNLSPFSANGGSGGSSAFNAGSTPKGSGSYDWQIPQTAT